MTANVGFGELWLDHRLGEQLKSGSEVTSWDVEDRLQPSQGDLDAEARTLGLQMLSEGLARMRASAFVEARAQIVATPSRSRSSALSGRSMIKWAAMTCWPGSAKVITSTPFDS